MSLAHECDWKAHGQEGLLPEESKKDRPWGRLKFLPQIKKFSHKYDQKWKKSVME